MVQINFGQREVSCKLVYYGPGMSGKTTNLEIIHQKAPDKAKGEMVSIATETDRTLYFDFLPLDLGQVAGMHTKFQLYTVPGQVYYNATRKLVLQGVDGVIFVADSNPDKMDENIESLENLRENLAGMGIDLNEIPLVLQYNKRDLPTVMTVEDMNKGMNPNNVPAVEAIARDGKGVFPTLKALSKIVIDKLNKEHAPAAQRRRTGTSLTPVGGNKPTAPAPAAQQPSTASAQRPAAPAAGQTSRPGAAAVQPGQNSRPGAAAVPPGQSSRPGAAAVQPGHSSQPTAPAVPPSAQAAPMAQHPGYAPTPRNGVPATPPPQLSPKEKHLQKAKPPALQDRSGNDNANLGPTDPHLKRFKEQSPIVGRSGGGAVKTLTLILLTLVICLIIVGALVIFVPEVRNAVRPYLPAGLQKALAPPPADSGT